MNFEGIVESFYNALVEARPDMMCKPFKVAFETYNTRPKDTNISNDSQEMLIDIAMRSAYKLVRDLRMDGLIPGTQRISAD